mmetsp:Transcript_28557/g.25519  ORF Transcript_28557/g.25519 Transcript_28557/m.25519 type:complete len:226 (-) Transcript_28557:2799-3476(-)
MAFVKASKSLLVAQGNKLKLLNKENGKFIVTEGTFANKPRIPKDEVCLNVSKTGLALVLVQLNLKNDAKKLTKHQAIYKAFENFFQAALKGFEQADQSETVTIKVQYRYAKGVVDFLLGGLYQSLRYLKALLNNGLSLAEGTFKEPQSSGTNSYDDNILPFLEGIKEKPSSEPNRLKKQSAKPFFENLTLNQIYTLLQILLNVDETLYAMTLHSGATGKLTKYWG